MDTNNNMTGKNKSNMLDNRVLLQAKAGDYDSFETLVYTYEKLLYSVAYRMMGNKEDAEDVVQEAFLKIYKNLPSCHHIHVFAAWATTITSRICIDIYRKNKNKKSISYDNPLLTADGEIQREFPDKDPLPVDELVASEGLLEIEEALLKISADQREMIILRDIEGLSYEEISEAGDIKIGTVKSRINRGRKQLAMYLKKDTLHKN